MSAEADGGRALASGALHDAAELARHVPTAMLFTSSTGGISHAREEDTPEDHLERAIAAYGRAAARVIAGETAELSSLRYGSTTTRTVRSSRSLAPRSEPPWSSACWT